MAQAIHVRCPAERCGIVFEPPAGWLGRNMHCPACGVRMTARPVAAEEALLRRAARSHGGRGGDVPRLPFVVVVDNVRSLWNVGAIFRTADACGVRRLALTGITGCPPREEIRKTALGAEDAVAWDYLADPGRAVREATAEGYVAVSLEAGSGAADIDAFVWPPRVCLVLGNEVAGVSPAALEACAARVGIPMLGIKRSLNVAVAFGIAAHRIASALAAGRGACQQEPEEG